MIRSSVTSADATGVSVWMPACESRFAQPAPCESAQVCSHAHKRQMRAPLHRPQENKFFPLALWRHGGSIVTVPVRMLFEAEALEAGIELEAGEAEEARGMRFVAVRLRQRINDQLTLHVF